MADQHVLAHQRDTVGPSFLLQSYLCSCFLERAVFRERSSVVSLFLCYLFLLLWLVIMGEHSNRNLLSGPRFAANLV